MLRQEFIANYKNVKNSQVFQNVIETLPEGVAIVEHKNEAFSVINNQFKDNLDVSKYVESVERIREYEELRNEIEIEFSEIEDGAKDENFEIGQIHNKPQLLIQQLLQQFMVVKNSSIHKNSSREELKDGDEEFPIGPQRGNHAQAVNLMEFLANERHLAEVGNELGRQSEIEIYLKPNHLQEDVDIMK